MLIKTSELLRWDTVVIMLFQTCLYLHGLGPYFKDYLSLHFSARALRLPGDAFSGARAHLRPDWWWPGRGFVSDQPHRRPKEWPQRSTQISRWPPPPEPGCWWSKFKGLATPNYSDGNRGRTDRRQHLPHPPVQTSRWHPIRTPFPSTFTA